MPLNMIEIKHDDMSAPTSYDAYALFIIRALL